MAATWADIQRLAADLYRVQLTAGSTRLSEQNCVQVVSHLIASKAITVIPTVDGQQYVTWNHLLYEARSIISAAGRIPLTELATELKVDHGTVENVASTLTKESGSFSLAFGEIVTKSYINGLCDKVESFVTENGGRASILTLTQSLAVPVEIFNQFVDPLIRSRPGVVRDDEYIITVDFVREQLLLLVSAARALIHETPLQVLFDAANVNQGSFFRLMDYALTSGIIKGRIVGSKQSLKSLFVPSVHDGLALKYVFKALRRNGLVSTDALRALSINMANLEKHFDAQNKPLMLKTCLVTKSLYDEYFLAVEESVTNNNIFRISEYSTVLNSERLDEDDVRQIVEEVYEKHKASWTLRDDLLFDQSLTKRAVAVVEPKVIHLAKEKAPEIHQKIIDAALAPQQRQQQQQQQQGAVKDDDDEDWNQKGGKKKKKSATKKAPPATTSSSSAVARPGDVLANVSLPKNFIRDSLVEAGFPEDAIDAVLKEVGSQALDNYRKLLQTELTSIESSMASERKLKFKEVEVEANKLYHWFLLFHEAAENFAEPIAAPMRQYVLKSAGYDLGIYVLGYFASDSSRPPLGSQQLNCLLDSVKDPKARVAISATLDAIRKDTGAFMDAVEGLSQAGFYIKAPNKEERRNIVNEHVKNLKNLLANAENPAEALLSAVLLVLSQKTSSAVSASGALVNELISSMKEVSEAHQEPVADAFVEMLQTGHSLVIEWKRGAKKHKEINPKLTEVIQELKMLLIDDIQEEEGK